MKILLLKPEGKYDFSSDYICTHSIHNIFPRTEAPPYRVDILYRVANTQDVRFMPKYVVLNYKGATRRVKNKATAREIMIENGINCPSTYFGTPPSTAFPIIHRPNHHERCENFNVFNTLKEWEKKPINGGYLSSLLPIEKEIRAYMIGGKCYAMVNKTNHQTRERTADDYWYEYKKEYEIPLALSVNIMKCFNLSVAGVDIIKSRGIWYVLEGNSAPSISGTELARAHTKALDKYITQVKNLNLSRPSIHLSEEVKSHWLDV